MKICKFIIQPKIFRNNRIGSINYFTLERTIPSRKFMLTKTLKVIC